MYGCGVYVNSHVKEFMVLEYYLSHHLMVFYNNNYQCTNINTNTTAILPDLLLQAQALQTILYTYTISMLLMVVVRWHF